MIVESMSSLVVGKLRGGKIRNIENISLKYWYLFIIGFLLEFVSVYLGGKQTGLIYEFLSSYFIYIHALSYIIIGIGLVLNFKNKSLIVFFIGHVLNFIVIIANNGQMPVSGSGLEKLGLLKNLEMLNSGSVLTHTLVNEATKFKFLGDVIQIPKPYPLPKMISIGDVFLLIGIFLFIQGAMLSKNRKSKYEFDIRN